MNKGVLLIDKSLPFSLSSQSDPNRISYPAPPACPNVGTSGKMATAIMSKSRLQNVRVHSPMGDITVDLHLG